MSYSIETSICSKNGWSYPSEAQSIWGVPYRRDGVTVHWWGGGETADKHDGIVNYFMGQAQQGNKSVNYVVSDIKITKMVEPDNIAWCSGPGNPTTVSIEFQPTLSDEGYKRGGWLISELEKRYGKKLQLWPHNHWQQTSCPGTIDINRLRAEADKAAGEGSMEPSNEGDVINLYRRLLRRDPEPGAAGPRIGKSFKQNFYEIGDSSEGTKVNFDLTLNEGDLTNYYRNVLGHDPNPNDIEFHINQHHGIWKYMVEDSINRPDFLPKVQANQIVELNKIIEDLKKQLENCGGVDPATLAKIDQINATTQETNAIVKETNTIVKWLQVQWNKIFK